MKTHGQKILTVVTEGGKNFGFGHITRCLSITNIFQQYGYTVFFLINGDDSIVPLFKRKPVIFNWLENMSRLLESIKTSSIVLIDSMNITDGQILEIERLAKKIIFIDDEKRRNILDSGFVVDWTILSDKKNHFYPKKENVTYLLGSKYTPLRPEFSCAIKNPIKEGVGSVMVSFGGIDLRNLSPIILKKLNEFLPNCKKNIVIGNGFTNIKDIEKYKDKNTTFVFNANTSKMIDLMQTTDLAIASGGQTLYELVKIGTPTIAILLVENAKDDTMGWHEVGSVDNIGWGNDENLVLNLKKSIELLKDKNTRQRMQDKGAPYTTPNGAVNLVNRVLGN